MAGYENPDSYFLLIDSFARNRDILGTIGSFYEKYQLERIGIRLDVVHNEGAVSPTVLWDRHHEKIYTSIDLHTRVCKNKHQEDLASLTEQLISNVERPLILSTLSPRAERNFLQALCATRQSQDQTLQKAWAAVDTQCPEATALGKARHLIHTLHAGPTMMHDSLYAAGGVWQRAMHRQHPCLDMKELQNFIADRTARLQAFGISQADTPAGHPIVAPAQPFQVGPPRDLQHHVLHYLSLADFPPTAHAAIHNTPRQSINKLPQVTDGNYEGRIETHNDYFIQHTAHGTVFHRTADVEYGLPQEVNTAQRFAVSYASGTMTVQALGQELTLTHPQAKQPTPQRKTVPCCTIA